MSHSRFTRVRLSRVEWIAFVVLVLVTWALRLCLLEQVPPGWRDDELINIRAISGQVLSGQFPVYFSDASGHEPLYHYLHAGILKALGFNVLGGHLLSVILGTLSIVLTYALCRRLFGRLAAVLASWSLTTSFWSLMYSRTAIRHISVLPFALAIVWLMPLFHENPRIREIPGGDRDRKLKRWTIIGVLMGTSLYTYPAARVLPGLLLVLAIYLAIFHKALFLRHWRGIVLALAITIAMWVPLGAAIGKGRSEAAAMGIGADARLAELAVPVRDLLAGDPKPLLANIWTTLGMFHRTGDPEWLYNIPGRPLFNPLGGILVWTGVLFAILHWKEPRYFTLLAWLGLGLLPTFASIPPSSLSHTILVQPLAAIFPALVLSNATTTAFVARRPIKVWAFPLCGTIVALSLLTNTYRDLHDYFTVWPSRGMVRFLYRADYRQVADYVNTHDESRDFAVASNLMGPWDRLALAADIKRTNVAIRLFDPGRVLLYPHTESHKFLIIIPYSLELNPLVEAALTAGTKIRQEDTFPFRVFEPASAVISQRSISSDLPCETTRFANGLTLTNCALSDITTGTAEGLLTLWEVSRELDLPPIPIVANPPPPGIYTGPRLMVFAHLLTSDGELITTDDGLWVDPLTLRAGDEFFQIHRFTIPYAAAPGPYSVAIGLYDPRTNTRWQILDSAGQVLSTDRYLIPLEAAR